MRTSWILAAASMLGTLATQAFSQTIYEPVRYQYGQYGEVFYGGTNPVFTSNHYAYLPESLRGVYRARRFAAPVYPYPSPYMPYGPGTVFISPHVNSLSISYPENQRLVFTDAIPYENVAGFGFTPDDARNEAYANVPRIQFGGGPRTEPVRAPAGATAGTAQQAPQGPQPPATAADEHNKAIPLLNWAKAERERNPALYRSLLKEARKHDAAAVEAFERGG